MRALKYRPNKGDIWLGPYFHPSAEAQQISERLLDLDVALRSFGVLPDAGWENWRIRSMEECVTYVDKLSRTAVTQIGINDDRHLITVGGTRGGKGTTAIIPNLCLYEGSVVCIDPKGENARITAARRGHGSDHVGKGLGQKVFVFDPYEVSGVGDYACWNPLDLIDPETDDVIERAAGIADALVVKSNDENAHFDESARIFIKALILYVASVYPPNDPDRNLITAYDLLINGARSKLKEHQEKHSETDGQVEVDPFEYLLFLMRKEPQFASDVISGASNMIKAMGDRERGAVLSFARRNLEFLERPAIQRVFKTSTFDLDSLKTDANGVSVFLCLPPQRMHDTSRFLRLMITACLERMYEIEGKPETGHPVLFILDEFASLRHMAVIEHAAGYSAGFGVKLWLILQDVTQLQRYYREGWETFMGNAGLIQAFANSDHTTLEYLSKKIGQTEISQSARSETTTQSVSVSDPSALERASMIASWRIALSSLSAQTTSQGMNNAVANNQQLKLTRLILPEEIEGCFAREHNKQLLLVKGSAHRPVIIDREEYFSRWQFLGFYEPDRPVPWDNFSGSVIEANDRSAKWTEENKQAIARASEWAAKLEDDIARVRQQF
ncbi:MAG: type IV secretory system conjugative DNA transfer family protein [Pseudomonadota bacterium]